MTHTVFVAGPVAWNYIVDLDALPQPVPHMEFVRSHRWTVGGTSAGKALNLRSLGLSVTLRTVVGRDEAADRVLSVLQDAGVDLLTEVASAGSTEQHLNLMDPRGGRVSLYLGTPHFEPSDARLDAEAEEAMLAADAVVVDLSEPARPFLAKARSAGRPVWCDLHDYNGTSAFHTEFVDTAGYLFLNDDKIADPAGFAAQRIAAGARLVVVTRGPAGAIAMGPDAVLHTIDAEPVDEVVDTNGAGDAFFAGYFAAHLRGESIQDCLGSAAHQAARCITVPEIAPR